MVKSGMSQIQYSGESQTTGRCLLTSTAKAPSTQVWATARTLRSLNTWYFLMPGFLTKTCAYC